MKKILVVLFLIAVNLVWGLSVYDVQYTTDPSGNSPYMDQNVTVTGIVTAVNWYSGGETSHFFISDPEGGEWKGVFVYNFDYTVELGDEVELDATVQEYYNMTELSSLTALTVISSGNQIPEPLVVTTADLAETEAYEGVLVQVNDITVTQDPNNYGEAYIDDGSGECQTDDAMYDYSPVAGDEYGFMRGMVDFSYDEYSINPRTADDLGYTGEPGYIEGVIFLEGGTGNVEDVEVTNGSITVNPDDGGEYIMEVPPGTYDVTASLASYAPQTITGVIVQEDQSTSDIDFTLYPQEEITIYDIQYTEDPSGDSPYAGQVVTVTGIVSGSGFSGDTNFFMCSDSGAYNGIYVYQFDTQVALGDEVTVTAEVQEYYNFTELSSVSSITINSSGNTIPEATEIATAELASSEAYEGVLVTVSNVEVITLPESSEYNEWYVDDASGQCQVDDGFGLTFPDMEIGDVFLSITGLVDYNFNEYGLNPRDLNDIETGQGPQIVDIYDIQFTEDASGDSPYIDQVVTVEGIVCATGFGGNNYFITSEEGGPWNGLYVYDDTNSPTAGDEVRITGTISEYYNFTELGDITSFETLNNGLELPNAELVSSENIADSESLESVFVCIQNAAVTQLPNDYNEWYVQDISGIECQIDDGFGIDTPEISIDDEFAMIYGIVDYSFDEYGLHPRNNDDIVTVGSDDNNLISADMNVLVSPNPFYANSSRGEIKISFTLEDPSNVTAEIYNLKGQKIAEIADDQYPAGSHTLKWQNTASMATSVYFYRIKTETSEAIGKFIIIN